jgi:hypothetical protein
VGQGVRRLGHTRPKPRLQLSTSVASPISHVLTASVITAPISEDALLWGAGCKQPKPPIHLVLTSCLPTQIAATTLQLYLGTEFHIAVSLFPLLSAATSKTTLLFMQPWSILDACLRTTARAHSTFCSSQLELWPGRSSCLSYPLILHSCWACKLTAILAISRLGTDLQDYSGLPRCDPSTTHPILFSGCLRRYHWNNSAPFHSYAPVNLDPISLTTYEVYLAHRPFGPTP